MKLAGVMLAAGNSRRFKGIKQLAMVDHQPMIKRALGQLAHNDRLLPELHSFTLILGAHAKQIAPVVPAYVQTILFTQWQAGMGASLAFAVGQLPQDVSHLLVTLADQIDVSRELLKTIVNHCQHHPDQIIAASYADIYGPPVIFPRRFFAQLAMLEGDQGARSLLKAHRHHVKAIDMPQALTDIDTQADLQRWSQG